MNGYCQLIFPDGNIYEGNFYNNKRHGYGEMIYKTGLKRNGNWINDKLHGKVKEISIDGTISELEYENGNVNSNSNIVSKYPDGRIFETTIYKLLDCKGKMTYPDGTIYKGKFIDKKRQGCFKVYKNNTVRYATFLDDIEIEKSTQCSIM